MTDLAENGEGLDLLTIGALLERKGELDMIGGHGTLAEFLTTIASSSNIAHHARIVRDHAIRRRLIRFSADLSQRAYSKDSAAELLQDAQRDLHQFASSRDERSWSPMVDIARETVEYVDQVSRRSTALVGIPTGYPSLDSLLAGWRRSDLIIVAARPSMGKTSFALGSALAAAKEGYRVGVLSIEMSRRQVGLRLHGMGAPIDVHALKTGSLSPQGWTLLAATAQQFESLPFWIDDSSVLTVEHIAAKARQLKREADWICWSWTICSSSNSMTPKHTSRASQTHRGNSSCSRKSWTFPYSSYLNFPESVNDAPTNGPCSLICATPARSNKTPMLCCSSTERKSTHGRPRRRASPRF